jgi:hypothetical protein
VAPVALIDDTIGKTLAANDVARARADSRPAAIPGSGLVVSSDAYMFNNRARPPRRTAFRPYFPIPRSLAREGSSPMEWTTLRSIGVRHLCWSDPTRR